MALTLNLGAPAPIIRSVSLMQLLWVLRGADMTLTTDQPFTRVFSGALWQHNRIVSVCKAGAYNVSCQGGIYTGAGKTGGIISPGATTYVTLTGPNKTANANSNANIDANSAAVYLSLTVGNTGLLTVDHFIFGCVLD